jgi:hypothetical protein
MSPNVKFVGNDVLYNVDISVPPVVIPEPVWEDVTDTSFWDSSNGTWDGSAWQATGNSISIYAGALPFWVGKRPTMIRLTGTFSKVTDSSTTVYAYNANNKEIEGTTYLSEDNRFALTFWDDSSDLGRFRVQSSSTPDFKITKIEITSDISQFVPAITAVPLTLYGIINNTLTSLGVTPVQLYTSGAYSDMYPVSTPEEKAVSSQKIYFNAAGTPVNLSQVSFWTPLSFTNNWSIRAAIFDNSDAQMWDITLTGNEIKNYTQSGVGVTPTYPFLIPQPFNGAKYMKIRWSSSQNSDMLLTMKGLIA